MVGYVHWQLTMEVKIVVARFKKQNFNFEEIDKIGSGGSSEVIKIKCTETGRFFALKKIEHFCEKDIDWKKMIRREIVNCSKVKSPFLVQIIGSYLEIPHLYILFKIAPGEVLSNIIETKKIGLYTFNEKIDFMTDVALALDAMHLHNIVHRDLKPANIHVGLQRVLSVTRPKATLLDLGIACSPAKSVSSDGSVFGTPYYFSPEQMENEVCKPTSDIFSFGTLLFEVFSGETAFPAPSPQYIFDLIQRRDYDDDGLRKLSDEIKEIIFICHRRRVKDRFQTGEALAKALQKLKK